MNKYNILQTELNKITIINNNLINQNNNYKINISELNNKIDDLCEENELKDRLISKYINKLNNDK